MLHTISLVLSIAVLQFDNFQVYSYKFVDLQAGHPTARLSVVPNWPTSAGATSSTVVPLSDLDEGAMEFELWWEIGEEFLTTSTGIIK